MKFQSIKTGKRLVAFLICLSQASLAITITEVLDTNPATTNTAYVPSTNIQEGRMNRNGIASVCGSVKTNPGVGAVTGSRQFDQYRFVALSSGCVTVTLNNTGEGLLFAAAYNEQGVNLSDTSLNYLGDAGLSPVASAPSRSFSFDLVAEEIFNIVVHEVSPGGGIGQSYNLDIDGVKLEPDFSLTEILDNIQPTPNPADNGITGFQTGRLNRLGSSSSCAVPTPNPGIFSALGSRQLDFYEFLPTTSGCAILSLSHSGVGQLHMVVYDENGFNALNPSANYLADIGTSAINNTKTLSLEVEAGIPFYVVIHEIVDGGSTNDSYTLNLSNETVVNTIQINSKLNNDEFYNNPDWSSETGIQIGRLTRDSVASDCSGQKPNPGLFTPTGDRLFDGYTFVPNASGCVEVTLTNPVGGLFSIAYDSLGINVNDPSGNYSADSGSSANISSPSVTYGFNVSAGVPFTVVVHEVTPETSDGVAYKITLRGKALYPLIGDVIFEDQFD